MVVFYVLCVVLLYYIQLIGTTVITPNNVYLSMFDSKEERAVLSAISHVNSDSSVLPSTKLHLRKTDYNEGKLIESALNISKSKISSIIMDSEPKQSHDALSSLLHLPIVSTRPYRATRSNQSLANYEVSVGPSTLSAMVELIVKYKWINLVVLYDVRWHDHVLQFLPSLPSSIHYLTVDVILDQSGLISETSKKEILFLRNDPAEAVVLFCDSAFAEKIITQVFPLFTYVPRRTHRWLLADPISSLNMLADSSQIILGFAPRVDSNAKTNSLLTFLSNNLTTTNFSSFLMFDAVLTFAHALHGIVVDNKWKDWTPSNNLVEFTNGNLLLSYVNKVNTVGTTGKLQFTSEGHRLDAAIDVMNLIHGRFEKIGEWTGASKLTMTTSPSNNKAKVNVVPLSQLKRKLKATVLEDPPFVMYETNPTTNKKELVGFSIDMVKEIAKMLNFDYEFYINPDGRYAGKNPDGSLAGLIGEVFKGNADMSPMPLTINSERLQYISFSKPYMFLSMDLVLQKPQEKPFDITGFMTPYTIPVWCMTLVTWIVVSAILSFVNYYSPYGHRLCDEEQDGDEFSWFNSLWFCLASMLQQGGDTTPRMFSGRVVVGFFWFCIIVWVSTYTANLAAVLTSSQTSHKVSTLEEVLEREYHAYVIAGTAFANFLQTSDYRVYRLLWERIVTEKTLVDSTSEGFDKVRQAQDNVYVEEGPFADYAMRKPPCDTMSVKDVTGSSSYGIAFAKDNPYVNNISIAILKMQEAGTLEDLKRKWWNKVSVCEEYKPPNAEEVQDNMRIQLQSMVGVYLVLGCGGVAAVVVIFIEKFWAKRRARFHENVRKGWTAVKTTTALMTRTKKPDAQTVVEAFQSNKKKTTTTKSPWGVPLGGVNQTDGIKHAATNEACEDLPSNARASIPKSGNVSTTVTRSPWVIPVKSPDVMNSKNNSSSGSAGNISPRLQGGGVVPLTSLITTNNPVRRSSRVSYIEVTSSNDELKNPDMLIDLEGENQENSNATSVSSLTPTESESSSITEEGKKSEEKATKDNGKKKKKKNKDKIRSPLPDFK